MRRGLSRTEYAGPECHRVAGVGSWRSTGICRRPTANPPICCWITGEVVYRMIAGDFA